MANEANKFDLSGSLEIVDTSGFSLGQLQVFCLQTHKEITRAEVESRALEIERNKLKTMVTIAEKQLKEAKANQKSLEDQLEEEKEKIIVDMMQIINCLKNVRKETTQESLGQLSLTDQIIQSLTKSQFQRIREIENDIISIKNKLFNGCNVASMNLTRLTVEQDKAASVLKENFERKMNVLMNSQWNMNKTVTKFIKTQSYKELQNFNNYKNKKIKKYLEENDKLTVGSVNYLRKIKIHNTMILDDFQDNHREIKRDVTLIENSAKNMRGKIKKTIKEMIENSHQIKTLTGKLKKKETNDLAHTLHQRVFHQQKQEDLKWNSFILEEALSVGERDFKEEVEKEVKYIQELQLKTEEKCVLLENYLNELTKQVNTIDAVIHFSKVKKNFLGEKLTSEQVKDLALADLEKNIDKDELRRALIENLSGLYSSGS